MYRTTSTLWRSFNSFVVCTSAARERAGLIVAGGCIPFRLYCCGWQIFHGREEYHCNAVLVSDLDMRSNLRSGYRCSVSLRLRRGFRLVDDCDPTLLSSSAHGQDQPLDEEAPPLQGLEIHFQEPSVDPRMHTNPHYFHARTPAIAKS
jgi:hypothetical protein